MVAQEEDREMLHAALKWGGKLTQEAASAILARTRDPADSWPLPRTERQVRARLDWLAARLMKQSMATRRG